MHCTAVRGQGIVLNQHESPHRVIAFKRVSPSTPYDFCCDKCTGNCDTYHCYKGGPEEGEGQETDGCPLYSHPAQMTDNRNCVLCMTCLKVTQLTRVLCSRVHEDVPDGVYRWEAPLICRGDRDLNTWNDKFQALSVKSLEICLKWSLVRDHTDVLCVPALPLGFL